MSKNTSVFSNNIKNYDLIRDILRHMYMYGNYSKGDIVDRNLVKSQRSCYDIIKRINNYLKGEYLETHKLPNRKKDKNGYRLKYDPFQCPINYLADTYQNCSYVVEDFIFYFTFLQSFKRFSNDMPYTHIPELANTDDISELLINSIFDYDQLLVNIKDILEYHEETLRRLNSSSSTAEINADYVITTAKAYDRFQELKELHLIEKVESNSTKSLYRLSVDIFEDFSP